ncbi:MAG: hypothetical protein Q7T96_15735 [Methylobacter sp.]|nr:hypothetical protein [Methylobacter sp.]
MQAIEFETIAQGHTIRIPDTVPDGVRLRVRLLMDEEPATTTEGDLKALLVSMTEGLTDEDLSRPREFGRELPEWDT